MANGEKITVMGALSSVGYFISSLFTQKNEIKHIKEDIQEIKEDIKYINEKIDKILLGCLNDNK
jgi:peptidoglycan hydrolase CwlO-like protein